MNRLTNNVARASTTLMRALALMILATLHGCADSVPEPDARLVPNPTGRVPLAAILELSADQSLSASITISDGDRTSSHDFGALPAGRHSLPVLGMRPDRDHDIVLNIARGGGSHSSRTFTHTTPPLPANPREFPPIDVQVSEPDRMEPGVTFLSVRRRAMGRPHWMTEKQYAFSTRWGLLVALDNRGDVVWYYQSDVRTSGIDRLQNGNILMHRADSSSIEIDLLGNVVRQYYAEDRPFPPPDNPDAVAIAGMQTLHHQPHQLPNGDFLAFSANGYLVEDYPTSETDPDAPRADQMVMADTVVVLTPEGEVVWSWNTMDYLDPFRIGYDTFWSYWWVRGFPDHADWSHGNGLSHYEADDSFLVSLRNQSAILKIDRKTGDIKWILGRHDNWSEELQAKLLTPVGDLMWPGYQHNPRMTHAGTVILFDNRAHGGAMPFEEVGPLEAMFSRGVEYEVDEENMTVRQIWTTGDTQGDDPCFSYAMSDAWRLPETDNRLVIFAFCTPLVEGATQDVMDSTRRATDEFPYGGRVVEYAGDDVVFRAEIEDEHDMMQWEVYGGFKSSGLYQR